MNPDLTLLVITSPIPGHHSTAMIDRTIESAQQGCGGARLLILCDGVRDESLRPAYTEYLARLRLIYQEAVVSADQAPWEHCSMLLHRFFDRITTEYVLYWEHDWLLNRPVPTRAILGALREPVRFIRLNKRANTVTGGDKELAPYRSGNVALLATPYWSANPHFARASSYRECILAHRQSGRSVEQSVMGEPGHGLKTYEAEGLAGITRRFGAYIYGPLNAPALVTHLNGRTWKGIA